VSDVEVTPTELVVSSFPARRSYSWSGCGEFKIWRPVWGIALIVLITQTTSERNANVEATT
jgi:hypothetical protein